MRRVPVNTFFSGPAGGVVGCVGVGAEAGISNQITFDMGGTSTDVCLIRDGEPAKKNLREMAGLPTPVVSVVTGEGGSGGALAIGVGNRVLMLEYAIYSVISPEGCAAILWGDGAKAPEAAEIMRVTAPDLLKLGVIDGIVPEPVGGAHRNWDATAASLRAALHDHLWQLRSRSETELIEERQEKFRRIGVFEETV